MAARKKHHRGKKAFGGKKGSNLTEAKAPDGKSGEDAGKDVARYDKHKEGHRVETRGAKRSGKRKGKRKAARR